MEEDGRGPAAKRPRSSVPVSSVLVLDTVLDAAEWWRAITRRWISRVLRSDDFRQPLQQYAVDRAHLQGVHLPNRPTAVRTQGTPSQGSAATPPQGGTSMEWS